MCLQITIFFLGDVEGVSTSMQHQCINNCLDLFSLAVPGVYKITCIRTNKIYIGYVSHTFLSFIMLWVVPTTTFGTKVVGGTTMQSIILFLSFIYIKDNKEHKRQGGSC